MAGHYPGAGRDVPSAVYGLRSTAHPDGRL